MINILLYNNSKHCNSALSHSLMGTQEVLIVTPNPVLADIARLKFEKIHPSVETVTISHFLKEELSLLLDKAQLENFQGKSELNILLGSLWKMGRSESSYELFKRCFQMLTDFRSFTMNEDILKTILEEYDEDLSGAVYWFHKLMMEMDIIDEHRSYFLLAETLREGDLPPIYKSNRSIIFWGFDFMTASQVDLLNSLAIRSDLYIPFYKSAFDKSKDLDWIKWLSKSESTITRVEEPTETEEEIRIISFSKNYLSKTLKSFASSSEFENKKINYVLGTKRLGDEVVAEIPFSETNFKVPVDLFVEKVSVLRQMLLDAVGESDIDNEIVIELIQEKSKAALKTNDYRLYKVCSLCLEQIIKWVSLSQNNEKIGTFDIKIIMDSVSLNCPRNSLFRASNNGLEIKTLKNIDKEEQCDLSVLCITSEYGPIKGSVVQYSENVEKHLASIGPIRRSEFEFMQLKAKLNEFLSQKENLVIIEEGILEHDLGWSSVIPESRRRFDSIESRLSHEHKFIIADSVENRPLNSISATRLQSFSDCPRKYHLNYVQKISPRIEIPGQLNFMQMGLLEHEVIENYLKVNRDFDEEAHLTLIEKTLTEYQAQHPFDQSLYEEYRLELVAFTTNIIKELLVLNSEIGLELKCEVSLPSTEEIKILGSIDCLGMNSETVVVLDFKRGGGSIPSQIGLKAFKKIQLWFYLQRLKNANLYDPNKKLIWGYINLSALDESLVYCNDEVLIERFKGAGLKAFSKMNYFSEDMDDSFVQYESFENELLTRLKSEKDFFPKPNEPKTCEYCHVSNICPRGEL